MVEKVDLAGIAGIWVTENPKNVAGVVMWCGYCRTKLHYDYRHMGTAPFLTLMIKMAEAHRETECPNLQGPIATDWHPSMDEVWEKES